MAGAEIEYNLEELVSVLQSSTDQTELEGAALKLASSDDPQALEQLGFFLRRSDFLARLDDVTKPPVKTLHLRRVLEPLASYPSPEVADLCLALAQDPNYLADDSRKIFLLLALAAVKPMSKRVAALFRQTNEEGYFATNAPLLVCNGSPRALELFESMMEDHSIPAERRVSCLRRAVVPHRVSLEVLESCDRLLDQHLEDEVTFGVIESVFDYQGKKWFGPHGPQPPAWRTGSIAVLRLLAQMCAKVQTRRDVSDSSSQAVAWTDRIVRALLARRGQ